MGIQRSVLTSCSTRFIGKIAPRASGGTALPEASTGGSIGLLKSAAMLYHAFGISSSLRVTRIVSLFMGGFLEMWKVKSMRENLADCVSIDNNDRLA